MFKTRLQKQSNNHGFTTIEVVMVVAVLAILLALAAPSVAQSWKNLKIAELDGAAREIFLTAQNELTDMKASGALEERMADTGLVKTESITAPVIKTLYYITSDSMNGSMPELSALMATLPGEFVLYLNPRTGDVTDVYYSKNTLTHTQVADLRSQLGDTDDRDLRSDLGIGYYGGLSKGSGEPIEDTDTSVQETLELINGEDLYLKLAYPKLENAFASPDKVLAEITLKDEHDQTLILKADGDSAADSQTPAKAIFANVISNNDYTLYVLLDSMITSHSFTQLYPSLKAGDDITVTVSLSYDGKPIYIDAPVGTVNSLYAAKYPMDITAGGIPHKKGVEFSNSRHLSNLRHYSGGSGTAAQMKDIDFTLAKRQETMLPDAEHHLYDTVTSFSPIALTDGTKQNIVVDGMGGNAKTPYVLTNFIITENSYAGLFSNCSVASSFKNLRLVDPQVSGGRYIGGLIGFANGNITVENCGVYRTSVKSGSAAGDGFVNGNSTIFTYQPAGGLIGGVQAVNGNQVLINKSFAAIPLSNEKETGGLVGNISGSGQVTIQNSYASGKVMSDGAAGGLVGTIGDAGYSGLNVNIVNSFSASDVFGSGFSGSLAGGLIGNATLNINSSYACGIVTKNTTATYGPLVGNGTANYTNSRYLSQSGNTAVSDGYTTTVAGITALEYEDLAKNSDGSTIQNSVAKSFPYIAALLGKAYPFPMVRGDYYGDWPEPIEPQVPQEGIPYGLCYYERYADGSWGFYGYEEDPVTGWRKMADTLDYTNSKTILEASYGVLVPNTTSPSEVKSPSFTWQNATQGVTLKPRIDLSAYGLHLYPLDNIKSLVTHANQIDRQVIDHQSGQTFYLNPYFGGAISTEALKISPKGPENPYPMQIRTEEHLRNRVNDAGWYYWQSHDIVVTMADTGNFMNNTNCIYDAKNYETDGNNTIYGLQRPLFATNQGLIKDLNLVGVNINQSSDAAALAVTNSSNSGKIENCHLLSGSIISTNGRAAGLAGSLGNGEIKNSTVGQVGSTGPSVILSGNGDYVAGLLGSAGDNSTILNCKVVNTQISNSNASGIAVGFIGYNAGAISNCTVEGDVSVSGSNAAGFVGENHYNKTIMDSNTAAIVTADGQGNENERGAAGFAYKNNGRITSSYTTSQVNALSGRHASGFVHIMTGGRIELSYQTGRTRASGTGRASGFCGSLSNGIIASSFSTGDVITQNGGNASGFVNAMTSGRIEYSYRTGTTQAAANGHASGFCYNHSQGDIENSFTVGSVTAQSGKAVGFIAEISQWNGYVKHCYAAVSLSAGNPANRVGFIDSSIARRITGGYWLKDGAFNMNVDSHGLPADGVNGPPTVTSVSFASLKTLNSTATGWAWGSGSTNWTLTTTPAQTHPVSPELAGLAYPYPRIVGLDFYGDWPVGP